MSVFLFRSPFSEFQNSFISTYVLILLLSHKSHNFTECVKDLYLHTPHHIPYTAYHYTVSWRTHSTASPHTRHSSTHPSNKVIYISLEHHALWPLFHLLIEQLLIDREYELCRTAVVGSSTFASGRLKRLCHCKSWSGPWLVVKTITKTNKMGMVWWEPVKFIEFLRLSSP